MRTITTLGMLALLAGCPSPQTDPDQLTLDLDGDGFIGAEDCDDDDADVYPGADEICDGIDNNCDESIDGDDALDRTAWFVDADLDGYGDPATLLLACSQPNDTYIDNDLDCDDTIPEINPDAIEVCDGHDNDCDGVVDLDIAPGMGTTYYVDLDSDGYGDLNLTVEACLPPTGYVATFGDCLDTNPAVNPGADEICDGIDNDCDTTIDTDAIDQTAFYVDGDNDGFGSSTTQTACDAALGLVTNRLDCDDTDPLVYPNAFESCNGYDDDCDGTVDEPGAQGGLTLYQDQDDDGFGNAAVHEDFCLPASLEGWAVNDTDCDDTVATVNPGALEHCNGVDDDCNFVVDDMATDALTWYEDADGDSQGNLSATYNACEQPQGYVNNALDCDDTNGAIKVGAAEHCDLVDWNCDGDDMAGAIDTQIYYLDLDTDGYGDPAESVDVCIPPLGYVSDGTDCDDTVATVNPGALEHCNGVDDDCNGTIDDDATAVDANVWYIDQDGDKYGAPGMLTAIKACEQPEGYVGNNTDCDDLNASISPVGTEACNGIDDDCDQQLDENGAEGADTYYADLDMDGYGDPLNAVQACDQPPGFLDMAEDCDDTNPNINPAEFEIPYNGIDEDCWEGDLVDRDNDGYAGEAAGGLDCDDLDETVNPASTELCDGFDNDCDQLTDEDDALDASPWYEDRDTDGYGDPLTETWACYQPPALIADGTDCYDQDQDIHPGATELCNGYDDNCDGTIDTNAVDQTTFYRDVDGDGYGNDAYTKLACTQPNGHSAKGGDCDDSNVLANPGLLELCETNFDDDCDGLVNEPGADDAPAWFVDNDRDGYGFDNGNVKHECRNPGVRVLNEDDCNDGDSAINPDAFEICDGVDNNCDFVIDDDAIDRTMWYLDSDGDAYGDPNENEMACDAPASYVADNTDCNDATSAANPSMNEVCDTLDNDCDGAIDENGAADGIVLYRDLDDDGWGSSDFQRICGGVADGYVTSTGDCDDFNALANPGLLEMCYTPYDDDCDGLVNEPGADDAPAWYPDNDKDGYGWDHNVKYECRNPGTRVHDKTDCNDFDDEINPGASEIPYNRVDEDCSGDDEVDVDNDGYIAEEVGGTDCLDTDPSVNIDASEICDGLDNDCDGSVDNDPVDGIKLFADNDDDGYGDPNNWERFCLPASLNGWSTNGMDCNDADDAINPDSDEYCDLIDHNCDGDKVANAVDPNLWFADEDGDSYGNIEVWDFSCLAPGDGGWVMNPNDCDDTDPTFYAGESRTKAMTFNTMALAPTNAVGTTFVPDNLSGVLVDTYGTTEITDECSVMHFTFSDPNGLCLGSVNDPFRLLGASFEFSNSADPDATFDRVTNITIDVGDYDDSALFIDAHLMNGTTTSFEFPKMSDENLMGTISTTLGTYQDDIYMVEIYTDRTGRSTSIWNEPFGIDGVTWDMMCTAPPASDVDAIWADSGYTQPTP